MIAQPTHGRTIKGLTECSAAPYNGCPPDGENSMHELSSQIASPLNGPATFLK